MKFINFIVPSKHSKLTQGHLDSNDLEILIRNHDGSEAYYCAFDCDVSSLKVEVDTGKRELVDGEEKKILRYIDQGDPVEAGESVIGPTLRSFTGFCKPALNLVQFDFDSDDIEESLKDTRAFIDWLDVDHYSIAFSGSKGFHVAVPFGYFGLEASETLPDVLKGIASELKKVFPTLDSGVYSVNNKFRLLNSRHPKTGLFKSLIFHDWSLNLIKSSASRLPEPGAIGWFYPEFPDDLSQADSIREVIQRVDTDRKSKELEKSKGGTQHDQTPFESFENKVCIERMLKKRIPKGERNEVLLRLVNDAFKIGTHRQDCESELLEWGKRNGISQGEVTEVISNIYSERYYYNHGCLDPVKADRCSGKCPIYEKLDPKKRPNVVDAPKKMMAENEKAKQITEPELTSGLLKHVFKCEFDERFGFHSGNLIKQGKDLFRYDNLRWKHLTEEDTDKIKMRIDKEIGETSTFRKVDSAFKHFMIHVPGKPSEIDMFSANPTLANFRNGTLHLIKQGEDFNLEFTEHNKLDFATNLIDLDYKPDHSVNEKFMEMLTRIFKDDPDQEAKIKCIQQAYGASLLPAFPHIFFFYGASNSGKSTILHILKLLLGEDENISQVPPHQFYGFHMETMANRLINLVTDINTRLPISEDIFKQIEDRTKIRIQRKGIKDIMACLPAVHLFGANSLPPIFDGSNKTMERRVSAVKFLNIYKGKKQRDVASVIFSSNPQGVLSFALDGLRDLVKSQGWFLNPESGQKEVQEWELENDPVAVFLQEAASEEGCQFENREGDSKILRKNNAAFIKRTDLWKAFSDWKKFTGYERNDIKRSEFYKRVRQNKFDIDSVRDGYPGLKGYGLTLD